MPYLFLPSSYGPDPLFFKRIAALLYQALEGIIAYRRDRFSVGRPAKASRAQAVQVVEAVLTAHCLVRAVFSQDLHARWRQGLI